jgi:peptide/nickel transport system substrate-binding protein
MERARKGVKLGWMLLMLFIFVIGLLGCSTDSQETASSPNGENNGQQNEQNQTTESEPRHGGVLKIIFQEDIQNMGFPAQDAASLTHYYRAPALETLGRYNENGEMTPLLAEKWDIDPDNKTITFYLKKGIKFHDGTDFNAEAVKWNIEQYQENKRTEVLGIKSIDVLDSHTVQLKLEKWDISLLESICYFVQMVSPTAVQEHGSDWAIEHPVGTGPFVLESWERDVSAKFVKNENYWMEGQPYLDGIELLFIKDENTAANAFKSGNAHVLAHVDPLTIVELNATGQYVMQEQKGYGRRVHGFVFNSASKDSPFADVKVRQAVMHAIATQAIVDSVYFGLGEVANQYYQCLVKRID